jgi:hypothetical protein
VAGQEADGVLSIEEALAAEADAIIGGEPHIASDLNILLKGEAAQKKRFDLNADERDTTKVDSATVEARKELYQRLNGLNRAALCFSGGGIRSATFCLGILQALAACKVIPAEGPSEKSADDTPAETSGEKSANESDAPIALENSLLGCFHYLSTVSGGGYVGSWLSAWRTRASFRDILDDLTSRPSGPDFEPPQISWLRAYSNYLTPRLGIGSADTWAAVAIVVRNMILNWLIIIPVVCFALLMLKLTATIATWIAHGDFPRITEWIGQKYTSWSIILVIFALIVGIICLIVAQAFTTFHRPAQLLPSHQDRQHGAEKTRCSLCRRDIKGKKCILCRLTNIDDKCFVFGDLLWAVLSAIGVTIFFTSAYFSSLLKSLDAVFADFEIIALTAVAGFVIYFTGWTFGRPEVFSRRDRWRWALSGPVYGALVGSGAVLFGRLEPYPSTQNNIYCLLLATILGVPWVLVSQLAAESIFVGLSSKEADSDSDREWLGRAAGWLAAIAIAWAVVAFLVFAGGYAAQFAIVSGHKIVVAAGGVTGVISGIVTALLGSSSKTPAKSSSDDQGGITAVLYNIGLAVAGPIFVAVLIVTLSVALDKVLFGDSLIYILQGNAPSLQNDSLAQEGNSCGPESGTLSLQGSSLCLRGNLLSLQGGTLSLEASPPPLQGASISPGRMIPSKGSMILWFCIGLATLGLVARIASSRVNINRFSLHALYRNRLIRAYLGASRDARHPDRFTGFDSEDNVRMHDIWRPDIEPRRLFHVVNIALNVVSTKRLAWQERKAESFTVSPKHCGSAYVGFRKSKEYGDSHTKKTTSRGIALGTAMAISGAAVSPNMGYHSSPSIALLLTLFNVRLGWWLGNPGEAGDQDDAYRREGPRLAGRPLFAEALGRTTDESPYVYLSDGGHFENLGLYEMVRRRCRLIVVVDAGCDPDFTFEDLGNAVRKIYIDLGVRIKFDTLKNLKNRPSKKNLRREGGSEDEARKKIPYHAIGTILYSDADKNGCKDGTVIYIKPAYHGTEGAAIRSYATANKTFPHETTADQWFTESQFESYRALGLDIGNTVLGYKDARNEPQDARNALREFFR